MQYKTLVYLDPTTSLTHARLTLEALTYVEPTLVTVIIARRPFPRVSRYFAGRGPLRYLARGRLVCCQCGPLEDDKDAFWRACQEGWLVPFCRWCQREVVYPDELNPEAERELRVYHEPEPAFSSEGLSYFNVG